MRHGLVVLLAGVLSSGLLAAATAAEDSFHSVGPGTGILITDGTRDFPCGFGHLYINGDQEYENGYAWHYAGVDVPYYGAFAECFEAPSETWEVCATVFDLTQRWEGPEHFYRLDAYIWDDAQGMPGNVLAVVTGFDPYPIALWPEFSRHTVPLVMPVAGSFWVGEWGNWVHEGGNRHWYIAADDVGEVGGCPFTNVDPDTGYPSGWQPCTAIWGPEARALGIGYYGHSSAPTSGTPGPAVPGLVASWGKVKSLYR